MWVRADSEKLHVASDPMFEDFAFVRLKVTVAFGAGPAGEPKEVRPVVCDTAGFLLGWSFRRPFRSRGAGRPTLPS